MSPWSSSRISLEVQLGEGSPAGCQQERMPSITNNSIAGHEATQPTKGWRRLPGPGSSLILNWVQEGDHHHYRCSRTSLGKSCSPGHGSASGMLSTAPGLSATAQNVTSVLAEDRRCEMA